MERLTVNVNGTYGIKGIEDIPCGDVCERNYGCEVCPIHKAIEKLATYEEMEAKIAEKFADCIDIKTILDSFCAFYDMQETNEDLAQCTLLTNEDVLKYRQWKEAEDQGLLLRLPCKVGDTIYRINQYAKEPIISMKVLQVRFGELCVGNKFLRIDAINDEDMGEFCYLQSEFGRNVFFTKEEAEQALVEMEKGNSK